MISFGINYVGPNLCIEISTYCTSLDHFNNDYILITMASITGRMTRIPILHYILFLSSLISPVTSADHPGSSDPCDPQCKPGFDLREVQMPACSWTCDRTPKVKVSNDLAGPFLIRFSFFFITCMILITWTSTSVKRAADKGDNAFTGFEAGVMLLGVPAVMACVSMWP